MIIYITLFMVLKNKSKTLNGRNIGTKLSDAEYQKISKLINEGLYLNNADFVREAIRDKLKSIDEITLRDIPREQQKSEIIDYCEEHKTALLSDIANDLKLDLFEVNEILEELI